MMNMQVSISDKENVIDYLRAKSLDQDKYLLKDHIIESLRKCEQLYECVKKNDINYDPLKDPIKCEEFFKNLAIAIILHDLGKITYDFQKKLFGKGDPEWNKVEKFLKPTEGIFTRHEILSILWSILLLKNDEWDKKVRTAILLHHYNEFFIGDKTLLEIISNYYNDVKKYLEFLVNNSQNIKNLLDKLFNYIKNNFKKCNFIVDILKNNNLNPDFENAKKLLSAINNYEDDLSKFGELYEIAIDKLDYNFLVFLGFLRRCDYAASAEVDVEYTDNIGKKIFEKLDNKIREKIFGKLDNKINEIIKNKTQEQYLWQEYVLNSLDSSNYLVLVAPTGSGKTEFALLWAKKSGKKLIYTLPLRVALNDLYLRFTENAYFNRDFVRILHSTAFLEYIKEKHEGKDVDIDKKLTSAKILSTPVLLSTPDQVFLTSLNYYGSDKIISVYPIASIVIDEIQTYNEEMAAILIKTLEIIKKLKGNILIITATLPPYYEKFLINNMGFKKLDLQELGKNLTKDIKKDIKNLHTKRHKIKLIEKPLFSYNKTNNNNYDLDFTGIDEFEKELKGFKGKNIIIVVNNVKKAIKVYEKLKKSNKNVYLLHSRLIEKEKDRRIRKIKEKIEKGEKVILVTTQLVEASVDIDFDAMITEISTIDSQIQRWGRVYRNRENDYDEKFPNIIVFTGTFEGNKLKIDRGTLAIYDKKVIEKTFEVLRRYENMLLSYIEEKRMINEVFELKVNGKSLKEEYESKIEEYLNLLNYFTVEKKSQAQKLFRRLVGISFVFPQLMKYDNDTEDREILKIFSEIILDYENRNKSWENIIKIIKEKSGKDVDKWTLKKFLYEYSVNVPIFVLKEKKLFQQFLYMNYEFKGFYVFPNELKNSEIKDLKEYGLDKIIDKLEEYEIEEWTL